MGAHHKPPASAQACSIYDLRAVNQAASINIEIVRGRCPKSTLQDSLRGKLPTRDEVIE
jgi:hypothetical protein